MDRSIQKNGLVNLAVALVIFVAGFERDAVIEPGRCAGQVASVFLGLGALVS